MPLPLTPVICGPTAGGKSDLALRLALTLRDHHSLPAEIVTADAFQVYRGMDIGTAKPSPADRAAVPHHLLDLVDPALGTPPVPGGSASSPSFSASSPLDASANLTAPEGRATQGRFTLDDWLARARVTIADLRARAVLPIVVGGTHLYVKALLDGLFRGPDPDPALRAELEAMNPAERRAELERVDPTAAARIHPNDARRTVRALEVHRQTGTPISALQTQWDPRTRGVSDGPLAPPTPATEFLLVTLDWETDPLNRRINARVKAMMDHGLLDEVRALVESRRLGPQAREALGYKQLAPLVEHALAHGRWPPPPGDLDDAVEKIKIETRRFAKNQRTWLRRLGATPGALRIPAPATPPDEWPGLVLRALGL